MSGIRCTLVKTLIHYQCRFLQPFIVQLSHYKWCLVGSASEQHSVSDSRSVQIVFIFAVVSFQSSLSQLLRFQFDEEFHDFSFGEFCCHSVVTWLHCCQLHWIFRHTSQQCHSWSAVVHSHTSTLRQTGMMWALIVRGTSLAMSRSNTLYTSVFQLW